MKVELRGIDTSLAILGASAHLLHPVAGTHGPGASIGCNRFILLMLFELLKPVLGEGAARCGVSFVRSGSW